MNAQDFRHWPSITPRMPKVDVESPRFLIFDLDGNEWSALCSNHFNAKRVPPHSLDRRQNGLVQIRFERDSEEKYTCPCLKSNTSLYLHATITRQVTTVLLSSIPYADVKQGVRNSDME